MAKTNQINGKDKLLMEKVDFYFNEEGMMVFTELYLYKRVYCCKYGCKHCPYGGSKKPD